MLKRLRENKSAQGTLLIIPTLIFMIGMLIIPLLLTLVVSFGQRSADGGVIYTFTLNNYIRLLGFTTDCPPGIQSCFTSLYLEILWRSLVLGFNTTVLDILLAFPLAYFIARVHPRWRDTLMFLVLVPMWTNFVIRVYAWMMILRDQGVINSMLGWLAGLVHIPFKPLGMLYTPGAVLVGMVYEFLPFMILPIYTSLEKIDNSLYEAAADLGASPFRTFLRVTLPLSMPGVVAGTILVFIPVMGTFIVSDLLGGAQVILIGNLIQRQFLDRARSNLRLSGFLGIDDFDDYRHIFLYPQIWIWRGDRGINPHRRSPWIVASTILVFFFLYAPIAVLMIFSFNASRISPLFTGVITKFGPFLLVNGNVIQSPCGPFHWFCELSKNTEVLSAARNTLTVAFTATFVSTIIGTMAALALQRYNFRPPDVFAGLALYPRRHP